MVASSVEGFGEPRACSTTFAAGGSGVGKKAARDGVDSDSTFFWVIMYNNGYLLEHVFVAGASTVYLDAVEIEPHG